MSLSIIKGPPNSGRTELVRERFTARLADEPILVVPSTDDIFGWERRLTRDSGVFLGGKVVHFKDLVKEILGESANSANILSPLRRREFAAKAIRQEWPAVADRLKDQPGLIDAALQTIDDFRDSMVGLGDLSRPDMTDEISPMVKVYIAYLEELNSHGVTDHPARAELASSRSLKGWQGRPVFVAGFDDMSLRQLELLRRLSRETEVTVAMTHEQGKPAMAVTEGLLGDLEARGGNVERETSRPPVPPDHNPLLVDLERAFLDRSLDGTLQPGSALTLIEASGKRGEAEAVGAEIARLVDQGTDPGEIAIVVDNPSVNGSTFRDVLEEYGVPATLESETKALQTVTGQAVFNLLRAGAPQGKIETLFALLRGPLGLDQSLVDELEFRARREGLLLGSDVIALDPRLKEMIPGWSALAEGQAAEAAAEAAQVCAANLTRSDPGILPGTSTANETQMSTAIRKAIKELASAGETPLTTAALEEALLSGAIKTWTVPVAGTVRIASPYSMRAKRVANLFIVSLQERDLGAAEGSPLISVRARSVLGMPDLIDQEQRETYLFYSCLAVPTERLWLSHRVADVHGKAEFPSAMIGEVTRLFPSNGAGLRQLRRGSSDVVFNAADAPSTHEWAISQAAKPEVEPPTEPELSAAVAHVEQARIVESLTSSFRDLDSPAAQAGIGAQSMFSASALEAFLECPYRWFFEKAMRPTSFGPDPVAIARGNLIHEVLADLYRSHSGELPTEADVDSWISELGNLVETRAVRHGLGGAGAEQRIVRHQVVSEVTRFLKRESTRTGSSFRPVAFEESFGFDDPDSKPPLSGDGWQLRGSIDRIDRDSEGRGVVIDYKSGASSYKTRSEITREGKIQLQLYLRALEQHWELEPAAGLYVPVFAAKKQARGLVAGSVSGALKDMSLVKSDFTEDLSVDLEAAFEQAQIAATKILRGEINHDPAECIHHFEHAGVPDWLSGQTTEPGNDR